VRNDAAPNAEATANSETCSIRHCLRQRRRPPDCRAG
jgi:hypothetical protein